MSVGLPVDGVLGPLLDAIRARGAAVLTAPPGSGKTTRVPPALAQALEGQVVVLEPRRMAARAAARQVAQAWGCAPGTAVGWQVRGENRTSAATQVIFATEGVLLRRLVADPLLEGVGAVVFDEFHERGVDADLALALCAAVREARPELALVAMSATLDPGPVAAFLDAPVLSSDGALFPVAIEHDPRVDPRPLEVRVAEAARALWTGDRSVLVFLPGLAEIRRAEALLAGLPTLTLHGRLDAQAQDAVLDPGAPPAIILSTNVAESSLTVPGVRAVVDAGLARVARRDSATGLDRLDLLPIARDAADQRAGRAGRLGPGLCRRLWTARDHLDRPAHSTPAVHRADLAGALLTLLAFGEPDPAGFRWFDPPAPEALADGLALLERLGATAAGRLTPAGAQLAALPLHPRLGRFLLEAHQHGASRAGARIAALLADGGRPTGELSAAAAGVDRGTEALAERLLRAVHSPPGPRDPRALDRAALAAWPDRLGRLRDPAEPQADGGPRDPHAARGVGVLVGGVGVTGAAHPLFVAIGLDPARRSPRGEWQISLQAPVEPAWLPRTVAREARFDGERVVGVERTRLGELVVDERVGPRPAPEVSARLLGQAARRAWARVLPDDPAWVQLLGRLRFLAAHAPHPELPTGEPASLEPTLDALCATRTSFPELARAPWAATLRDSLSWAARQHLDRQAPERVPVGSGQQLKLDWTSDPPVLAARIQHLFGTQRTPQVCGRPVRVHLLAPNGRPQQITEDLEGFWRGTYTEIRKELRARYPRHPWPEDPTQRGP